MPFRDVSHDGLCIAMELCALKKRLVAQGPMWTPTTFPSSYGSSSSPSKKTTSLSTHAVVDYDYSLLLTLMQLSSLSITIFFRVQRCAGVVLLRGGMTNWKALNSGSRWRPRSVPQYHSGGRTESGFCASVEAFLSHGGMTCAVCSTA